jgi:hypothetical protein
MNKLLYILVFLLGSYNLSAQEIEVSAKLDKPSILIGEEIKIDLSISYRVDNGEVSVQFPILNDTIIERIEVLFFSKIDTLIPNKEDAFLFEQKQQISVTSYDSGYYQIPPFIFIVNNDTFKTEPLLIDVQNMEVDTSKAIFDIKTPLEEPYNMVDWLKDNWKWIAGTLALLILILLLIIYLTKKKPAEIIKVVEPIIPPHIIAIQRLENLNNQKLWQDGKVKQYHSEISEIIRQYIEKRYQVNALEETTSEIMHGLRLHGIDSLLMTKLNQTFVLADLVKFAKEKPIASENEMSINNAIEFVNNTKIIEQPKNANNAE